MRIFEDDNLKWGQETNQMILSLAKKIAEFLENVIEALKLGEEERAKERMQNGKQGMGKIFS